jgi:hypothetical protein
MTDSYLLRCTQRLLKSSRVTPESEPLLPKGILGEWYANTVSLPFPGRSLVIFTSAKTLLTVVAPGRILRTTIPVFQKRLPILLKQLELAENWITLETGARSEVHVARTENRRVLGSMNDLAHAIWFHALETPSFDRFDLDRLELQLAETPFSFLGMSSPERALRARRTDQE